MGYVWVMKCYEPVTKWDTHQSLHDIAWGWITNQLGMNQRPAIDVNARSYGEI